MSVALRPSHRDRRGARTGRGTLAILALLLAASGALRFGSGVGQALARAPEISAAAPAVCAPPPLALAEALSEREAKLAAQEIAMEEKRRALSGAESAIAERLAALQAAEAELSATLALADGAAEGDLTRLTAIYEAMKPKDAAGLFESMAPDFAAGFLGRMRPEAAAAVMSGLSAETAYAISATLAGRNALVPRN